MPPPSRRLLGALCATALALAPCARVGAAPSADGGATVDAALAARLLGRFAPLVLLAPGERALPANVEWYLARARPVPARAPIAATAEASLLGSWDDFLREVGRQVARLRPNLAARPGSSDPRDWVVYGHVYRGRDGDLLVQYWFFYPFNDFHVLFDHEGDWEHVTVRLDRLLRPLGAWYARHMWSAPGKWFAWPALQREGDHPVVLSARGSHASYAEPGDVLWWDRACSTRDPAQAAERRCAVWRTWAKETGGIVDVGARDRPHAHAAFVAWPGEWGTIGWFRRSTGGPRGPAFQDGWCSEGRADCS